MFKDVEERPDFPKLERHILNFWEESRAFDQLVKKNRGKEKWSFFDGPITANNPMGVHHAWGRSYKDIFIRHKAMQGFDQRYQNGFDCQGLWLEVEVEKELGLNSKPEIVEYGLSKFAEKCKERVKKFSGVQTTQSLRLGQWMDWENSYYTMSDANIETIWHFLKKCHEKGWLYEGQRSMPWCIRCGTSLSHHELYDSYKEMKHKSVTMALPIVERPGEYIMAWTTTPWTLSANTALAVHPELKYAKVEEDGKVLYLSASTLKRLKSSKAKVLQEVPGKELIGLHYRGPMDIPARKDLDLRVIGWTSVGEEEGTGVVHIAPGCGAEDYELAHVEKLAVIVPIDEAGYYTSQDFGPLCGKRVNEVAELVFEHLREHGYFYGSEEYRHRYPVCWRCREELVFRVVGEWFIRCEDIRAPMKKAAEAVRWIPDYAGQRMLNWLDTMGDWCISRRRFWGLPLPFYHCESCGEFTVVGSKRELEERAVCGIEGLKELHRPWIDGVKIRCNKCKGEAKRIEAVGDCWLDAGIISFSTLDYLHDKKHWQEWFPCEFITEMIEQVRLWFYSMLFMSVTLENRPPYRNVLTFSAVVDSKGEQFSKTLGNAIPFDVAAEKMGADIMRWMYAGQNIRTPLKFGYDAAQDVYRKLLTLWNVYKFFVTYANLDKPDLAEPKENLSDLDRWLLSRLNTFLDEAHRYLDRYETAPVINAAEDFFDDLSNWYLRRSRRRFWKSESDADKTAAYRTLYSALTTLCKALAPIVPFSMEYVYQNLVRSVDKNAPDSVHLNSYPVADPGRIDVELMEDMKVAEKVCTLGHSARDLSNIKVRQPLAKILVYAEDAGAERGLARFADIVRDELNVKEVEWISPERGRELSRYEISPNLPLLGPKYGKALPKIKKALAEMDASKIARAVQNKEDCRLSVDGEAISLAPEEVLVKKQSAQGYAVAEDKGFGVALDTVVTEELRLEGIGRDLIRIIQNMRKEADFHVADQIHVTYETESELLKKAIHKHGAYIREETIATSVRKGKPAGELQKEVTVAGENITLAVSRVATA